MKYIPWAADIVVMALCPVAITSYGLSLLIQILVFAILAMSMNILVGQ